MKSSKIIATTAIATVMTASSAYAELSVSGGMAGWWISGDSITSSERQWNTGSVNISYGATLDNGMGLSVTANVGDTSNYTGAGAQLSTAASVTTGGANYTATISSDMGSLSFGDQVASAADAMDNSVQNPSLFACCTFGGGMPAGITLGYNDGDGATGNDGVLYKSPTVNGWQVALSHGMTAAKAETGADDTNGIAAKGSLGGVALAFGMTDIGATGTGETAGFESSFAQAGMSFGDIGVSYGMYDGGGANNDGSVVVIDMPLMGMSSKVTFVDVDGAGSNADEDGYSIGLAKSLGAATFGVEFAHAETGSGSNNETETWKLGYQIYF